MNQEQYSAAKDIVLDLLGWAVPPEYLVDCGLSREIVYYVFSELNLRLPQNLDVKGLVPYPPAPEMLDLVLLHTRQSSSMPPPPARSEIEGTWLLPGHPSLPPKPPLIPSPTSAAGSDPEPVQRSGAPPASPTIPTPSSSRLSPETPLTSNPGSLHDMERQRRQELRARKAVQASRKPKQSLTGSSDASSLSSAPLEQQDSKDQDVEMASVVRTETVEDFLKSIGPVPDADEPKGKSSTPDAQHQQPSVDGMEVDEIPGLGGGPQLSHQSSLASLDSTSHADLNGQSATYADHVVTSPDSTSQSQSQYQNEHPPSSSDSQSTTFEQASSYGAGSGERFGQNHALQRRGIKRPVAADFVDFEPGPRHGSSSSSNGYTNGGVAHPNHQTRRKTAGGSFASVSGMRRCVIDVSDSEGEGEGEGEDFLMGEQGEYEREQWVNRSRHTSPVPGRYAATPIGAGISGWATPPYLSTSAGSLSAGPASGRMSPAALMEKELEIRKMRELIAVREQSRLKKLAVVCWINLVFIFHSDNVPCIDVEANVQCPRCEHILVIRPCP